MSLFQWGSVPLAQSFVYLLHPSLRRRPLSPPHVDCEDCERAKRGTTNNRVRCCYYIPNIPNFLAGEVLACAPNEVIQRWSEERGDPLYIHDPPGLLHLLEEQRHGLEEGTLPLDELVGCEFLAAEGGCTIYKHRPATCLSYYCFYDDPVLNAPLWRCLRTLLELLSLTTALYLLGPLGLSRRRFQEVWRSLADTESAWTPQNRLHPEVQHQLWQEESRSPAEYYQDCFRHLVEHKETIRQEVVQFQRENLLRTLRAQEDLSPLREAELLLAQDEPEAQEPDPTTAYLYRQKFIPVQELTQTIPEVESHLLWYLEQSLR